MFETLTLNHVEKTTPDAVVLGFEVPDRLRDTFAWQAGQYLTLRSMIDGQDVRRSYSIASTDHGTLRVGVKQIEEGVFSSYAQGLSVGDTLDVMAPEGRFVLKDQQDIVLIAAGSGVTPMVSIAADALARGARVTLVYGNRDTAHIMFKEALDTLKDRYLERFTAIHILSREEQDVPLLNGRISGAKIEALANAGAIDLETVEGVFLCGPGEMIDEVSVALKGAGVAADRIHTERFTPDGTPAKPRSAAAQKAAERGVEVELILDGSRRKITMTAEDDTVLDAAERSGLDLPYSCKGGMCCTCRCQIAAGSAEMAVNYSLEQWEIDAGFTLACQARPTSEEKLVLDFDAA